MSEKRALSDKEILSKAAKLLGSRFTQYIIIVADVETDLDHKYTDEHWAEGVCRRYAIDFERGWHDGEEEVEP